MLDILDEAILTAWNSARTAGSALLAGFEAGRPQGSYAKPAEPQEFKSFAEKEILRLITDAFPEHGVLFSGGGREGDVEGAGHVWYVNSLDGAFNYTRNSPFFSISIGFLGRDRDGALNPLAGVVLAPALMEMFWATLGGGAHYCQQIPGIGLTEGPISVSDTGRAEGAVVKTWLGEATPDQGDISRQGRIQGEVMAFSKEASASLNLAYVAAGRAECFYSSNLRPVDAVPATLIVSEAGGRVSDYQGRPWPNGEGSGILATNGLLHGRFMGLLSGGPKAEGAQGGKVLAC
ncbi:MAG: inositol monophosphatase [Deltaproteobacteria bacterium]|jgi:myo-inositol-1(or 4)-monophosphatase|nr:inositol monophosphatase [Deltaproteobacteria bacterium]